MIPQQNDTFNFNFRNNSRKLYIQQNDTFRGSVTKSWQQWGFTPNCNGENSTLFFLFGRQVHSRKWYIQQNDTFYVVLGFSDFFSFINCKMISHFSEWGLYIRKPISEKVFISWGISENHIRKSYQKTISEKWTKIVCRSARTKRR